MSQVGTSRIALIPQVFWLEWIAVGWMVVEAGVAIWSGTMSRSLVLNAFGADGASLGIVWFPVKEGREAWSGEDE